MNQFSRSLMFWLILGVLFMTLWSVVNDAKRQSVEISYSKFLADVETGKVTAVTIQGKEIKGKYDKSEESFLVIAPEHPDLIKELKEAKVEINVKKDEGQSWLILLLVNILPVLILVGLWVFFMRQMSSGAGKGMSFGKSKAKLLTESQHKVTFKDVAGVDEARGELVEIVDFLKDPKKFTRLGGRIPKGVLLAGAPGTGKTLLAKAIAGEAGVPFFSISGSDFVEMFVGVGASRVRDLFVQGKKNAPCIIFIDEIDAVGRHRGAGMGGGHDEREQTLNQLLVEMDGFESNEGVILIAATNRPDVLDPALLRPGRFDRRVIVPAPDLGGRKGILEVHTKSKPISDDVDLKTVARGTPGFSGAELEILVNEAALNAARYGKDKIEKDDFEFAKDKVMMGAERRSMILSDKEKETTAYHEAGHALVASKLEQADPVHKLTIIPRGMALGLMQQLPEDDKHTYSRAYWLDQLAVFYGGRVAEEIIFNELNTGASNDIQRATKIARRMVTEWGMSDKVGPIHYSSSEDQMFMGRDLGKSREHSEQTQIEIDHEVERILMEAKMRADDIIKNNVAILHAMAQAVIVKETLNADEIKKLVLGEAIDLTPPVRKEAPLSELGASLNGDSRSSVTESV